jgi:signal transduction histidine kinase
LSYETNETLVWPVQPDYATVLSMLRSDYLALPDALDGAAVAGAFPDMVRPVTTRRAVATNRPRPPLRAQELAPVAARTIVSVIAAIGIGLTIALSITDVLEVAPFGLARGDLRAAILSASLTIPLHVRHLVYGVRGERPPGGTWTLTALAILTVGAVFIVGDAWLREFSPLAVSVLIVVPGRRGYLLFGAIVLAPLVLMGVQWHATVAHPLPSVYFAFVVVWRTSTQFVLLRLLAALRALESAGDELEARAVVQSRVRIDTELRKGIGAALQRILVRGDAAREAAELDPARAAAELRHLVGEARRGLDDARRMVTGYRESSVRAELDAVAALLEASGAMVHVVVADSISLDATEAAARDIIRAALADALRGEPRARYRLDVLRNGAGALAVSVTSGDEAGPER